MIDAKLIVWTYFFKIYGSSACTVQVHGMEQITILRETWEIHLEAKDKSGFIFKDMKIITHQDRNCVSCYWLKQYSQGQNWKSPPHNIKHDRIHWQAKMLPVNTVCKLGKGQQTCIFWWRESLCYDNNRIGLTAMSFPCKGTSRTDLVQTGRGWFVPG